MAAVTAAVIGGVATVAATGMSVAQSQGAMGGGGGGQANPQFKPAPQNPQDKAMRGYYERALVTNADKTYPSFSEFLQSGGDPAKAKFDLDMPEMKPSEAAAFGLVGPHGENIPGLSYQDVQAGQQQLSPQQILYLAQERRREAATAGQKPGPWASKVGNLQNRQQRLQQRQEDLSAIEQRTPQQERKLGRVTTRLNRVTGKLETITNPD